MKTARILGLSSLGLVILGTSTLITTQETRAQDACHSEPSVTAWLTCKAEDQKDARHCRAIPDVTLAHFCEERAGDNGCVRIIDATMNALCQSGVRIR